MRTETFTSKPGNEQFKGYGMTCKDIEMAQKFHSRVTVEEYTIFHNANPTKRGEESGRKQAF
jgi:hypothetical protein